MSARGYGANVNNWNPAPTKKKQKQKQKNKEVYTMKNKRYSLTRCSVKHLNAYAPNAKRLRLSHACQYSYSLAENKRPIQSLRS